MQMTDKEKAEIRTKISRIRKHTGRRGLKGLTEATRTVSDLVLLRVQLNEIAEKCGEEVSDKDWDRLTAEMHRFLG